jgi:hypothetical protein
MFKWFDTQDTDNFAKAMAEELMGRVPAAIAGGQKTVAETRLRNAHDAIIARAAAHARRHKLNWYQRARLGNTFRWLLLDKGYDKEFVDVWTHNMLVAVTSPDVSTPSQNTHS